MKSKAEKLRNEEYYGLAHQGSTDLTHPAMKVLLRVFQKSQKILDMGCGEGTRLETLRANSNSNEKKLFGIDASYVAIRLALKEYPQTNFQVANLEKLPFRDAAFDLLYSAYVFEHLLNPELVIKEAYRVLRKNGRLIIIAPNFGSPNRRSPNSKEDKISKLFNGAMKHLQLITQNRISHLNWKRVEPIKDSYTIDADTTIEPDLLSLTKYCRHLGFRIEYFSSNWPVDRFSFFQLVFRMLGSLRMPPFMYWGPHLSVVLRK